jgi:uncharacterized protein (TIGR01777 family)
MASSDASAQPGSPERNARRVAVTGSSGLIGAELCRQLTRDGHPVVRLVRSAARARPGDVVWDPEGGKVDAAGLEGVDAVVHLAGESVGARWTAERKARIVRSRVNGTRALAQALARLARKPEVLVTASAVGIYGDRGTERVDEDSQSGTGFLAEVAREWEAAARPAEAAGIRVANLRFGVVLSGEGGALRRMLPPFRLGVGGRLGSGRQWMSWVSLEDVVGAIRFAMDRDDARGPLNVVAPHPVTNAQFTAALGRALGRPTPFPVPAFALRLLFGQMADEALLGGQRAHPARLLALGYRFRHPELDGALAAALRPAPA